WSAVAQGLDPLEHPAWTSSTEAGLARLGLDSWPKAAGPAHVYDALRRAHARIRALEPALSALHVDHFLALVAAMRGRDLPGPEATGPGPDALPELVRKERARCPIRKRLKERFCSLHEARARLQAGLAAGEAAAVGAALAVADPVGAGRPP